MTTPVEASRRTPPYKVAGAVAMAICTAVLSLVYLQFRGSLSSVEQLTMVAPRAGLSLDPGSKVTFNGVVIGRVGTVDEIDAGGQPKAEITLDVDPKYLNLIPANVHADITASTVFGNKYVALSSPKSATPERITSSHMIDASKVTTEFNTLFETGVALAQQVDPIMLNQTLSATAEALDGLGNRFGQSIIQGSDILADLNSQMPQIRYDTQRLADLFMVYANASPDLFDGLDNTATTAGTLNDQASYLDQALIASLGLGNTGGDVIERGGPYFVRSAADSVPTTEVFDEHSPALFCTIRNFHDVEPKASAALGGNGYSGQTTSEILGAGNPYVYPDNLPRTNAHGGPEGRPGCWQPITRDLWPAPYLVMDTGASIAPYNHFELGQPILTEYIWGRQIGENTINP